MRLPPEDPVRVKQAVVIGYLATALCIIVFLEVAKFCFILLLRFL